VVSPRGVTYRLTCHQWLRKRGEPAGQIAAREMEVARLRQALRRAEELTMDVAMAIEEMAEGVVPA
jgi:hypothetical protein